MNTSLVVSGFDLKRRFAVLTEWPTPIRTHDYTFKELKDWRLGDLLDALEHRIEAAVRRIPVADLEYSATYSEETKRRAFNNLVTDTLAELRGLNVGRYIDTSPWRNGPIEWESCSTMNLQDFFNIQRLRGFRIDLAHAAEALRDPVGYVGFMRRLRAAL